MKTIFFEDSFLCLELTSISNLSFIEKAFQLLTELEDDERNSWDMTPESQLYFRVRPIGGKRPINLNLKTKDLFEKLVSYNFKQNLDIEFINDVSVQPYREIIRKSICFSNQNYSIFIYSVDQNVEYLWFDSTNENLSKDKFDVINFLNHLGVELGLILIDWYKKEIIYLTIKDKITIYLERSVGNSAD
jgi:hypothetical protein